jgi:hypothetical protein
MVLARTTSLVTVSLFCLVAMPASGAMGAMKKKSRTPPRPAVGSVVPLSAGVGDQLTIKGNNFVAGKLRNKVFFKAGSRPAVSVRAPQATTTMLKVVIPKGVERYMTVKDGAAQPTRFRLRVLAKRFSKGYVAIAKSPMIAPANAPHGPAAPGAAPGAKAPDTTAPTVTAPGAVVGEAAPPAVVADCDGDGLADSVDGDDDNDRLTDALELAIKTDPCNTDSDGDGNEDAFEYHSALDLNNTGSQAPLPYPGRRPYPNPLDPADADTDYDGDGLRGGLEHALWQKFGARALPLNFSDGTKFTGPAVAAPTDPAHAHLNIVTYRDSPRELAELSDDEKDSDNDRLGNWDEANGRMNPGFWPLNYPEPQFSPFYSHMAAPMYLQPDFLDADSDGDGVLDGDDDQDHDAKGNVDELIRVDYRVHPYNPCLPDYRSPTCPRYFAVGDPIYAPFHLDPPSANPVPWPEPVPEPAT